MHSSNSQMTPPIHPGPQLPEHPFSSSLPSPLPNLPSWPSNTPTGTMQTFHVAVYHPEPFDVTACCLFQLQRSPVSVGESHHGKPPLPPPFCRSKFNVLFSEKHLVFKTEPASDRKLGLAQESCVEFGRCRATLPASLSGYKIFSSCRWQVAPLRSGLAHKARTKGPFFEARINVCIPWQAKKTWPASRT